ncbi:hypothetical protein M404DRAFT_1007302 [Pisolithus tinctorius Marx 270]|uniref:Uncharacterized protein n=1 Tax=Pisolithus tinctorius Marx 270 TaxID=870435 RepID=A0A0C3IF88_PISTI|nr:hypothetical protein M404DRAFT_1007302 [Pisolithus tinctorius Marx 270]
MSCQKWNNGLNIQANVPLVVAEINQMGLAIIRHPRLMEVGKNLITSAAQTPETPKQHCTTMQYFSDLPFLRS